MLGWIADKGDSSLSIFCSQLLVITWSWRCRWCAIVALVSPSVKSRNSLRHKDASVPRGSWARMPCRWEQLACQRAARSLGIHTMSPWHTLASGSHTIACYRSSDATTVDLWPGIVSNCIAVQPGRCPIIAFWGAGEEARGNEGTSLSELSSVQALES